MKKVYSLFIAMTLIFAFAVSASANGSDALSASAQGNSEGGFDLKGLSSIGNNSDFEMSDVLTFDEIAQVYADDHNITLTEAKEVFNRGNSSQKSLALATYRTFTGYLGDYGGFKPILRYYCSTTEGGGYIAILKIETWELVRSDGNVTKQFVGTVKSYLENASKIHYIVNGDWYNNGATTTEVGASINVGGFATITYKNISSDEHYWYGYYEGNVILSRQ
ncbi:hypothetical protein [Paenibacillus sp. S28]|uniref:hypothetical protein n=1 Tax=Paenibacillus sp. S28 TaxID=2767463 RepID=UPI001909C402|nr:hypothetical protein [Paenibacillus sp. S28]MBJ9989431.1 hypothetical protein [Paenibacillus sp. S28]